MQTSLKNLVAKAWQHRREFFKYFVVGASAFILDTGSLFILTEFFSWQAILAVAVTQPFILGFVFWANQTWSFGAKGTKKDSVWQMIKFLILAGGNYFFSLGWMWVLHHELGIHPIIARVANIILAVGWNFLLYKCWVYKTEPVHNNPIATP